MDCNEIADRLISVFFPQRCLFCNEVVAYDDFWCGVCEKNGELSVISHGRVDCGFSHDFADALAATQYSGGARKLIWRVKSKGDKRALRFFTGEMLAAMSEHWGGVVFDVAVPVPTTETKMKERGFNPAELLAQSLCRRAGIPLCNDALIRLECTRPQRGLTATERRENAETSYAAGKTEHLNGKRVLLVDDVFTTGSTAEACSVRLTEAGAACVYVVTASFTKQDDGVRHTKHQ